MVKRRSPSWTSWPSLMWTRMSSPPTWALTATVEYASTLPMARISSGTVFRSTDATVTGTAGGQRERAEQRGRRRQHDRTEAEQAGLVNGGGRRLALAPLHVQRDVGHHDRVLLDDPDEENDPDERDDVEIHPAEHQGDDGAHARRGQRREDRDRVDVALVEDAEHDVDGDERGQGEDGLIGQRGLKRLGRALEARPNGGRQADVTFGTLDGGHRVAERDARGQIERERHRREEALMVYGQRGRAGREVGDGAERDLG